jgi:ABC-type glutathione transport system ATPase component
MTILNVVRLLCDRALVMTGAAVESGPADAVVARPRHPCSRARVASIPGSGRAARAVWRPAAAPIPFPPSDHG